MACNKKRKIILSKIELERQRKRFNTWQKTITEIESIKIPPEQQENYVREILPSDIYGKLGPILDLKRHPLDVCSVQQTPSENALSLNTIISNTKDGEVEKIFTNNLKNSDSIESLASSQNTSESDTSTQSTKILKEKMVIGNPYITFLKKPENKACIWNQKNIPEPTFIERSDTKTRTFVDEFCAWLNTVSNNSELNESIIMKMFRVDMNADAARPIRIAVKQLRSIPTSIAQARHHPNISHSEVVNQLLNSDIKAEKLKPRLKAFSKCLPSDMQFKPPRNQTAKLWRRRLGSHEHVESMAHVWHNITDLKSTREYCKWLLNNPQYSRPPYLKSVGCISKRQLKTCFSPINPSQFQA